MSTPTEYIDSLDYKTLVPKLKELVAIHDDLLIRAQASRQLRFAEIDVEEQRSKGTVSADEIIIPHHIIDTNIRREQAPYIQYVSQSPRAVILEDEFDSTVDLSILEKDLTKKIRYPGWQIPTYSNIDGFQQNGYGIIEVVYDKNMPGHLATECVQYEDFAFISDTKDLQSVEMTSRKYYFTRTQLNKLKGEGPDDFSEAQIRKLIEMEPSADSVTTVSTKDASLYKIYKNMMRVNGIVYVAWSSPDVCDDWLRIPRKLFVGRKSITQAENPMQAALLKARTAVTGRPVTTDAEETMYPYFFYPYSISEDTTIANLRGRVFRDQDIQEAVTSIMSSLVTKLRRSAGLYFARKDGDPNNSILMDKNVEFKSGVIFNGDIKEMKIDAPEAMLFAAVQGLISGNQAETSQINFAETNRQNDSRKTAAAIKASTAQQQQLTTVQVVLFSLALKDQYNYMADIIKSRVQAGLINVHPTVRPFYDREFIVKPSGDTDVIERQQLINLMMQAWPVIANSPLAQAFFVDLVTLMFPDQAAKYKMVLEQSQQQQQMQQQSQQAQMLEMLKQFALQAGTAIENLAAHPEYFSDTGKVNVVPKIEDAAKMVKQTKQQLNIK